MKITLPEIILIGIYDSNIVVKNKSITNKRKTTMFEIELPIEKGGISYINDEHITIEPNLIICSKPGRLRHTKLPYKCYYIHMIINPGEIYEELMELPDFITVRDVEKYEIIFKELYKFRDNISQKDEIMIQSLVLKLIYFLVRDSEKTKKKNKINKSNQKIIESVIKYIKGNLTEDLSLNKIAEYAGFSPIHFHNCFKASTGLTLHEYVEEQRIKKAADMLVSTGKTLTQIAYECGFSSQSYLSYAFKRKMKMTPRQYTHKILSKYDE